MKCRTHPGSAGVEVAASAREHTAHQVIDRLYTGRLESTKIVMNYCRFNHVAGDSFCGFKKSEEVNS
jgi:hypothetical protein